MLYCNRLVDRHISPFSVLLALGLTERERAKAVKPGGTVYTCGMPFLIHKGGVVRYRSTDSWEKLFKARTDESVAALEAIAADLGLAAGTPRAATPPKVRRIRRRRRLLGRPASLAIKPSGLRRSTRAHESRAGRETADNPTGRYRFQPSAFHPGRLAYCCHPRWPTCNGQATARPSHPSAV